MRSLIYQAKDKKGIEDRPKPKIQNQTDAIVKVRKTTICGTDLHILKGDVSTCVPGRILGHEGIGLIDQVGSNVSAFSEGDQVLISCISSCSKCEYCRRGMYSH
ncbi:MAG: alcohol dehydrogenase catalytic domain-containing protein, partial [Tatlockia sp.]|nr:alcohol dehydrogenase catalytic domain-containing protein [Tatlockia sp.]